MIPRGPFLTPCHAGVWEFCVLGWHELFQGATSRPQKLAANLAAVSREFSLLMFTAEDTLRHFCCSNWKKHFQVLNSFVFKLLPVKCVIFLCWGNCKQLATYPMELLLHGKGAGLCGSARCWPLLEFGSLSLVVVRSACSNATRVLSSTVSSIYLAEDK